MTPKALSREIKFRMWSIRNKFMDDTPVVYKGAPCTIDTEGKIVWMPQDDTVLMQFTGLLDKNGKEIYEGDIVRVITDLEEGAELLMKVEWENGAFILYGYGWAIILCEEERYRELEIISNIYENPELLTKENK